MKINGKRLWNHLQELGKIGENSDGSVTRLAYSDEDEQAKSFIECWMKEAGLDVYIDACGNVIGTLPGQDRSLSPVVCGSHFDTVKEGGIFDGCLGVLAGIEVLQTMKENQIMPLQDIRVIGFRDEEGNRFGYGMIGSHSVCGIVDKAGLKSQDFQGRTLEDVMLSKGYQPQNYSSCYMGNIRAYLELHIEQASLLSSQGCPVGIVTGIAGLERYTMTIHGRSAHSGATPMNYRQDPVLAMSKWILKVTELAKSYPSTVATVGVIETHPGACNIICDHVTFSLDLRSLDDDVRKDIMLKMKDYEIELTEELGVSFERRLDQTLTALHCHEEIMKKIEMSCQEDNVNYQYLVSGAGHDCMNFKNLCPTGMIFVASQNHGASHCKEEFSTFEDCQIGCQILFETLVKL